MKMPKYVLVLENEKDNTRIRIKLDEKIKLYNYTKNLPNGFEIKFIGEYDEEKEMYKEIIEKLEDMEEL